MKIIINVLSSPILHFVLGLLFYFFIGCCIWAYESFDKSSFVYGALFSLAFTLFDEGLSGLFKLRNDS